MKFPKAPVVMIGYTRVDTMLQALRRLSLCNGVDDRDLYLVLDAPAHEGHRAASNRMLAAAEEFRDKHLPNLKVTRRSENYGVPRNQIESVTEVINRYGRVIFFEDDVLVSKTFLEFQDEALEVFKDDKRIFCVNGYYPAFFPEQLKRPKTDVYVAPRLSAWGVGLWADRWNLVDFEIRSFFEEIKDARLMAEVYRRGHDIYGMLAAVCRGKLKTWDAQCTYLMAKKGMYAVGPRYRLTKNIGFGGDCLHCRAHPYFASRKYYNFLPHITTDIKPEKNIFSWYRVNSTYKRFSVIRVLRFLLKIVSYANPSHLEPYDL